MDIQLLLTSTTTFYRTALTSTRVRQSPLKRHRGTRILKEKERERNVSPSKTQRYLRDLVVAHMILGDRVHNHFTSESAITNRGEKHARVGGEDRSRRARGAPPPRRSFKDVCATTTTRSFQTGAHETSLRPRHPRRRPTESREPLLI